MSRATGQVPAPSTGQKGNNTIKHCREHQGFGYGAWCRRQRGGGGSNGKQKKRTREPRAKKLVTLLDLCVSSLRRGHANLLCIVPILTDDLRRESERHCPEQKRQSGRSTACVSVLFLLLLSVVVACFCFLEFLMCVLFVLFVLAFAFVVRCCVMCSTGCRVFCFCVLYLCCVLVDVSSRSVYFSALLGSMLAVIADGHTASNTPDLFRPPKLSGAGPGQYWGGGPPGKTSGCCQLFVVHFFAARCSRGGLF